MHRAGTVATHWLRLNGNNNNTISTVQYTTLSSTVYFGDFLVFHQHQHMIHGSICAYVRNTTAFVVLFFFFFVCVSLFCFGFVRTCIYRWAIRLMAFEFLCASFPSPSRCSFFHRCWFDAWICSIDKWHMKRERINDDDDGNEWKWKTGREHKMKIERERKKKTRFRRGYCADIFRVIIKNWMNATDGYTGV